MSEAKFLGWMGEDFVAERSVERGSFDGGGPQGWGGREGPHLAETRFPLSNLSP